MEAALKAFGTLVKQPLWIILAVIGGLLVVVGVADVPHLKHVDYALWIGLAVLAVATGLFVLASFADRLVGGVNTTVVEQTDEGFKVRIDNTDVLVTYGRIEDEQFRKDGAAIVLPVNEYFDEACFRDEKSSAGSFVRATLWEGRRFDDFMALLRSKLPPGKKQLRAEGLPEEESHGAGTSVFIDRPCGQDIRLIVAAVTTHRPQEGLHGSLSLTIEAIRRTFDRLAANNIRSVSMPVLGTGKGNLPPVLAFVGLILALAEVLRSPLGRTVERVTVVVFKPSGKKTHPEVHERVIRRTLALAAPSARANS